MKQKICNTIIALAFTGFLLALFPSQGTISPTADDVQTPAATEMSGVDNGIVPMSDNEEILSI